MNVKRQLFVVFLLVGYVLANETDTLQDSDAANAAETLNDPVGDKDAGNSTTDHQNANIISGNTTTGESVDGMPDQGKPNITYKVSCIRNSTAFVPVVEMVNSSELLLLMEGDGNITSPQTPAPCLAVLFYSPACPFSCLAAPHFNALPRIFPEIRMAAVDTSTRYNFNAQYGIAGLPSLLLFHNGRAAARFNSSSDFTLEELAKFITNNTGIEPQGKLHVTSVDFKGPISSVPVKQTDYCLIVAWLFILLCCLRFFYHSSLCRFLIEAVRSAWREAEAQHHTD